MGVPAVLSAAFIGLLLAYMNARFNAVDARFNAVDARFNSGNTQFASINQRFDDMRDFWHAELNRFEQVLDARLKHIEEERR